MQDGSLLLYRIGAGSLHSLPDALSRNPCKRDELILARTGDWVLYRKAIRGVQEAIEDGRFSDDSPPPYTQEDVDNELKEFSKFQRDPEDGEAGADEILKLAMPYTGVAHGHFVSEGLSVIREERVLATYASAAVAQKDVCRSLWLSSGRTRNERAYGIWQRIQGSGPIKWLPD